MANGKVVDRYSAGAVHGSVWRNKGKDGDYDTAQIVRRYKDKDGKWQSSSSFRPSDLGDLKIVAQKCAETIRLRTYSANAKEEGEESPASKAVSTSKKNKSGDE